MNSPENPTRTRILRAARELLSSSPGVAARMSDIAKHAGVSRQALYLHFPNRTELFIETTRAMDADLGIAARLHASRNAPDGRTRMAEFVIAWGNYIPEIYGVAKTLIVMAETDEDAARAWTQRMNDMREGCEAAISALASDGALAPGFTETTATDALWMLLTIPTWESLTQRCGWTQDAYIAFLQSTSETLLTAQHAA